MTRRINASLTIWTGVLLLLLTTKSQSQTTVESITPEIISKTTENTKDYELLSGNSTTILRKTLADQEVDVFAHLPALKNDRERQTPFHSSTAKITTESSVDTRDSLQSNIQNNQRKFNYQDKYSNLNNSYNNNNNSNNKTTTKLQKIDLLKTDKNDKINSYNQSKKHFFEQLISPNGHKIPDTNSHELSELNIDTDDDNNNNDNDEDNFEEELESREATTPGVINDYGVVSLINDTQVNYKGQKKEIHEDAVMINNKNNKVNKNKVEKLKNFDDQVEIINTSATKLNSLEGIERIQVQKLPSDFSETEIIDNKTDKVYDDGKNVEKTEVKSNYEKIDDKAVDKNVDKEIEEKEVKEVNKNGDKLDDNLEKEIDRSKNRDKEIDKNDDEEKDLTPKGRTISFGGANRFSSTEEKAIGSTKENTDVNLTKDFKPYPYFKTSPAVTVNNSAVNLINDKKSTDINFNKETDEIYTFENTINKNKEDDKKLLITESSVINNNIQTKPVNLKRSSNTTKILTDSSLLSPSSSSLSSVTVKSIPAAAINTTLNNNNDNLKIKDNVNDIPRNPEEVIERKSALDLSSNGLNIENIDKKNSTFTEMVTSERPIIETTENNSKINLNVNNTTEQNVDIKSDSEITAINETESNDKDKTINDTTNYKLTTSYIKKPLEATNLNSSSSSIKPEGIQLISTSAPTSPAPSFDVDEDVTTSGITTNKLEITSTIMSETTLSPVTSTTTMSNTTSKNFSSSETLTFNSSGRGIDLPESTTSAVEYEFVGLNDTTSSTFISNNDDVKKNISTTLMPDLFNTSMSNNTMEINTTESITKDSNSSTDELLTTTESILTDTTSYTTKNFDYSSTDDTTNSDTEGTTIGMELNVTKELTDNETNNSNNISSTTESLLTTEIIDNDNNSSSMTSPVETTVDELNTTMSTLNVTSSTGLNADEMTSTKIESNNSTVVTNIEDNITTTVGSVQVVTEDDVQRFTPGDVTLLVRIVVEGTWSDICQHLPALKQSLANLLTAGMEKPVSASQIIFQKNPCTEIAAKNNQIELILSTILLYVIDENGNFDATMTQNLPNLYSQRPFESLLTIRSFQLVQDGDSGNAIAVIVVSCVAFVCLVLLASLLFIMRKRQTRFNYGERCRPVSLDAYSLDSVSAYNSVRRKGAARASKRSYGNPTFEDSTVIPSHPLNFAGLSAFCNEQNAIYEEFTGIPQVSARIDELPPGAEVKNRYANVVPLPETRVPLMKINNDPLSEYINASYVRGPKNATKYYIACQAPMESTVTDFWRMIWEQQSKVIIMLTDLIENGVDKCSEYIPPSEVTDCHRLYGDYQVTLKKRETKEKYAISTIHLKNLENNTYREVFHIWYLWPANGVQTDAAGLIAILLEARALQRGGPGPIVVHCSPGTGRTGTLIALDLGIRQYEITRTVDVPRVVYTIRRDRAGAVQTKEQYAFIYKALNLYATKLAGGGLEST
ncbi:receptor-type tyrosine-protein phosphatase zeta isoform X2 [Microplitis mediator]|nr:receptor-type tyrosine-protein phosphatase zeta isoform X2 [Microplitis mediator]XP_057332834.1 receptor-type tyrosine-protein phosphatase zeta isoform X2 [Microplitis mediator]